MSAANPPARQAYQFAAEPQTVKSRSKYRGPNDKRGSDYEEMRNDPRVKDTQAIANSKSSLGTNAAASKAAIRLSKQDFTQENAYVALSEQPIQDEATLIPDYYVDKPPTPEFKPLEPGVDVATQIEDNELFDFKLEVEPVLQVLVGKTLEQAQLELREEDERMEEMRHRMRFEKTRNAELMVTQRKEALHIRKQEEKKRREKQHNIQQDQKALSHQKYIAKLLSKNVTFGMGNTSINILADQGVLRFSLKNELKKDYIPYLIQNTLFKLGKDNATHVDIQELIDTVTAGYITAHAKTVKTDFDRKKKIEDDRKAEEARLDAERKRRRERRRKLRLHYAKAKLLEQIQATIVIKPTEITDPWTIDVSDIFPGPKESISTIGGILGELWLLLEVLQTEQQVEIKPEELVQIFVKILNEKSKAQEFGLYLKEQYEKIVQDTLTQMSEDLVAFNKNKAAKIEELSAQLEEMNLFENLGILQAKGLLNNSLFKQINKALLSIFFTSVDYKEPEKKPVKVEETQPKAEEAPDAQPKEEEGEEAADNQAEKQFNEENNQLTVPTEEGPEVGKATEEAAPVQPLEPIIEAPEEPWVMPEITPLELAMVEAKKKLKFGYVKDWEFRKECDAIIRFRTPLNREVKESPREEEENAEQVQQVQEKNSAEEQVPAEGVVVEQLQETFEEKINRLIATDEFIEPFDGTTFEKEKVEFPEQVVEANVPVKVYNTSLLQGKYIAQINERSQAALRKELISIIKEYVAEWKDLSNEDILAKAYAKYTSTEKAILSSLIPDSEQVPIFDIESI